MFVFGILENATKKTENFVCFVLWGQATSDFMDLEINKLSMTIMNDIFLWLVDYDLLSILNDVSRAGMICRGAEELWRYVEELGRYVDELGQYVDKLWVDVLCYLYLLLLSMCVPLFFLDFVDVLFCFGAVSGEGPTTVGSGGDV